MQVLIYSLKNESLPNEIRLAENQNSEILQNNTVSNQQQKHCYSYRAFSQLAKYWNYKNKNECQRCRSTIRFVVRSFINFSQTETLHHHIGQISLTGVSRHIRIIFPKFAIL